MASPYVYERQSEYWISRRIEEFFLDVGFEVVTFPLTQYNERLIPADFIFFDKRRSKLFGFQYKALYHNEEDFWPIDPVQHEKLAGFPWIYYCLSELKTSQDHRAALYLIRVVETDFEFRRKLHPTKMQVYSRWGAFYQGLERCSRGVLVSSQERLNDLLKPKDNVELPWELADLMVDVFIADFATRHSVHLSPQLKLVDTEQRDIATEW